MNPQDFKNFFEPYSKNVDQANSLAFWKLSDEIITKILQEYIPVASSKGITILDAGGGTGRWICDLSKIYESDFILYDLSEDMLKVASKNIDHADIAERVKVVQGDIINMEAVPDESIDVIISIYSPISFVYDKKKAIEELYRVIKKGGIVLIMGHGYHNALASKINNFLAPALELAQQEKNYMVKWGDHVPPLNLFSKESMEALLTEVGFQPIATYGVPVFVQPGPEDFDSSNVEKSRISKALEEKGFYDEVLALEMKYNSEPSVANRGMNIFAVVRK